MYRIALVLQVEDEIGMACRFVENMSTPGLTKWILVLTLEEVGQQIFRRVCYFAQ